MASKSAWSSSKSEQDRCWEVTSWGLARGDARGIATKAENIVSGAEALSAT